MTAGVATELAPLKALIVEDSEEDFDLLSLELRRGGFRPQCKRVETASELSRALGECEWDLVISDYSMPRFSLSEALRMVQQTGRDVPFLIVSATIGEEAAVAAMKAGAHDYILKSNLERLGPAVRRELREARIRHERKSLEEQLRQAQKLESIGLLAGGVAHDFNNLLTGIMGNASLVLEILDPPEPARSMLNSLLRATERAADLTRQLLAYAGKGQFVLEPVNLSELVTDTHDLIRLSMPKTVKLRFDLDPNLPAIHADATQMRQLMMNLALNAGEAMADRPGYVTIRTATRALNTTGNPEDGAANYVLLEVKDEGCGMDAATVERIFDPFFTTKFTGRGLGLSAVQGIVRSHNGLINVYSKPEQGSTFEILIPSMGAYAAQKRAAPDPIREGLTGTGGILLVDDEEIVRSTAAAMLSQYGYSVFEADNGRTAIEVLQRNADAISLVILDMAMPVMSGQESYSHLKRIRPDIPVLVASGYDETETAKRFPEKVLFIQKPFTAIRLAEKVKAALDGSGLIRAA